MGGGKKSNKKINCCSFTAESEREKQEWIEAVKESIAETLYDYEVAEKIWFKEANRSCADCRAPQPEWASVNLGVVICKKCAGKEHRYASLLLVQTHTCWMEVGMLLIINIMYMNVFQSHIFVPMKAARQQG